VEGKEEQPFGLLQKRYGYAKEKTNQEFKEFIVRYGKPPYLMCPPVIVIS